MVMTIYVVEQEEEERETKDASSLKFYHEHQSSYPPSGGCTPARRSGCCCPQYLHSPLVEATVSDWTATGLGHPSVRVCQRHIVVVVVVVAVAVVVVVVGFSVVQANISSLRCMLVLLSQGIELSARVRACVCTRACALVGRSACLTCT